MLTVLNYKGRSKNYRTEPISPDMTSLQAVTCHTCLVQYACYTVNLNKRLTE